MTKEAGKIGQKLPVRYAKNGRNKEEAAVDSALDAAADAARVAAAASCSKTNAPLQSSASSSSLASSPSFASGGSTPSQAKRDPSSGLWRFLDLNPNGSVPELLKTLLEENWDNRKKGEKRSDLIGHAIDRFEESDGTAWRKSKSAVSLFRRLKKIRDKEMAEENDVPRFKAPSWDYPLYKAPEH